MAEERANACLVMRKELRERSDVAAALDYFRGSGIKLDIYVPSSVSDLRSFVPRAISHGFGRIVVGGGDGTLNIVADAMMRGGDGERIPLGISPLGTANDFAKSAGIDQSDLIGAIELACIGTPIMIDVGRVGDRYFVNAASAGFGAEVTATTPKELKSFLAARRIPQLVL